MIAYKGYVGRMEVDEEAKVIHGRVLGLRDVITFQGDTVEEAERAFRDSIDDYLDFCKQRNEPPERPHSGNFQVRLGADLHRRLTMAAEASGVSLNELVRRIAGAFVQQAVPATGQGGIAAKEVSSTPKHERVKRAPARAKKDPAKKEGSKPRRTRTAPGA